jgi:heat shock protein HslJ
MSGPPERMEQENRLLHQLQSAETMTVSGDGMSLMKDRLALVKLERSEAG